MKNKTENKIEDYTKECFVVFFDILGFKDMMVRLGGDEVYKKFEKLIDLKHDIRNQTTLKNEIGKFDILNFSDSFIFVSEDNSINSLEWIEVIASYFFIHSLRLGIPLKGAIAYGKMKINKEKQIYIGQPLIDAFQLQEDLKYYGIVVHHTLTKFILDNKPAESSINTNYQFNVKTPFKYGKISHFNFNWIGVYDALITDEKDNSFDEFKPIEKLVLQFQNTSSGAPRLYVDNTLEVISEYRKLGIKIE